MSTTALGAGAQPAGASLAGLGVQATATAPVPQVFDPPAVAIDPIRRDYTFDANGNRVRMSRAQQLVVLALNSIRGMAAVADLGLEQQSGALSDKTVQRVKSDVYRALSHLTTSKPPMIQIVDVTVQRAGSRLVRSVKWRDLSTKAEVTTPIPGDG